MVSLHQLSPEDQFWIKELLFFKNDLGMLNEYSKDTEGWTQIKLKDTKRLQYKFKDSPDKKSYWHAIKVDNIKAPFHKLLLLFGCIENFKHWMPFNKEAKSVKMPTFYSDKILLHVPQQTLFCQSPRLPAQSRFTRMITLVFSFLFRNLSFPPLHNKV